MDSLHDKGREKRQFPRFPFKQAVKFRIGEYSCPDGSLSRDLSRGGICLTVNEFVAVKSLVVIYLQLNKESRLIQIQGIVSWVQIIPDSERYQVGIHFAPLEESIKNEVNRIIVALC